MIILPYGDINPTKSFPFINYLLIAVNITAFFLFSIKAENIQEWGFIPDQFSFIRIFTSMFLHAGIWHLLGNMLFLWICGDNVEDRVGHIKYFFLYIVCGFLAAVAHDKMTVNPEIRQIPCIGASGAVSGVLGAYCFIFPQSQIRFFYWFFILMGTFTLPSVVAIGLWFAKEAIPAVSGIERGIAHWAHVGGFLTGLILAIFLVASGKVKRRKRDVKVDW